MDFVRLGSTGLKVSRLCLGCMTYGSKKWRDWVLDEDESRPFFRRALELGINFFDTADMYSVGVSEEVTGRALKEFAQRDKVVIATKVFNPMGDDPNQQGLSRKHIHHAIDDSLRRLGTDYVDLYQIHRFDYETPIEETLRAQDFGDTMRARTDDYAHNLYYQPSDFAVVDRVTEIAQRRGVPHAQVALAWMLQQPGITAPIIGASKMKHLDDAVAALSVKLDEAELKALSAPYQPHAILGHS
jgi:aryl-alcohol dehydrogenase-like predicted oxidoreductase